ncbi:hypothetical protein Tco_1495294, partial [Tanacetum coccineum]
MESEYIFHVESENEDEEKNFGGDKNEDKDFDGNEEEDDGKDCDSSDDENDDKRYSLDPSWPQSY